MTSNENRADWILAGMMGVALIGAVAVSGASPLVMAGMVIVFGFALILFAVAMTYLALTQESLRDD